MWWGVWLAQEEECHAKTWKSVPRTLRTLKHGSKKCYPIRNRYPKMYLNIQLVGSVNIILEDSFSGDQAPGKVLALTQNLLT